jgi:hypothetical protein
MGRQHVRKGMMTMRRQKTGVSFNVEVTPRLQEAIDAMPASNHLTFLVTAQGEQFTAAGFGNHFRDLCTAAKLPARCISDLPSPTRGGRRMRESCTYGVVRVAPCKRVEVCRLR